MKNKKTTAACIFPETIPGDGTLFPLVQVFSPVVHCQAVEENEIPLEMQSPLVRELAGSGLLQAHVPSELGEQRERFLALVRDLNNRRDDYAGQLKSLSLAGIGTGGRTMKESKNSIIESLLQSKGVEEKKREQREMVLWQARLLLKLGELFDSEQQALQRELDKIGELENNLFAQLREEQEQPFSLTKSLGSVSNKVDDLHRLRLKAWTRLYFLGNNRQGETGCFVTTSRDAVDLLAENYERLRGDDRYSVHQLLLPAKPPAEFKVESITTIHNRGKEFLPRIHSLLSGHTRDGIEDFGADDGAWAQFLETIYPETETGRCRLHLYSFNGIRPSELFMESFGRDEEVVVPQVRQQEAADLTVTGWLDIPSG